MNERKSDELHDLQGTEPHDGAPETQVVAGRPRVPKNLSPEARRIFKLTCAELEKRRALTSGDALIIELLATTVEKWRRASKHVADEGEIVEYIRLNKHGEEVPSKSKNLWLGVACEAESKITSLLDRLGLTPINRSRVRAAKSGVEAGLEFLS